MVNDLVVDPTTGASESPYESRSVRLLQGVEKAILRLNAAGYVIVVASNQPAAAKGTATPEALRSVHARVVELLGAAAGAVVDWRYCLHHPQAADPALRVCGCRKPAPGLLLEAAADLDLDLRRSWMVGDADRDVEAAHAAGCRAVLVEHPGSAHRRGVAVAEAVASDLVEATELIVAARSDSTRPAPA